MCVKPHGKKTALDTFQLRKQDVVKHRYACQHNYFVIKIRFLQICYSSVNWTKNGWGWRSK